jgi:hypothetical protein
LTRRASRKILKSHTTVPVLGTRVGTGLPRSALLPQRAAARRNSAPHGRRPAHQTNFQTIVFRTTVFSDSQVIVSVSATVMTSFPYRLRSWSSAFSNRWLFLAAFVILSSYGSVAVYAQFVRTATQLSVARREFAATSVGSLAIFAGGRSEASEMCGLVMNF